MQWKQHCGAILHFAFIALRGGASKRNRDSIKAAPQCRIYYMLLVSGGIDPDVFSRVIQTDPNISQTVQKRPWGMTPILQESGQQSVSQIERDSFYDPTHVFQ